MYYETLIPNLKKHIFKNKSTIVFLFDIEKLPTKTDLMYFCEEFVAENIVNKISDLIKNQKLNLTNAMTFKLEDSYKHITFIPINDISNKINSYKVNQINEILEKLERHIITYDLKDIYFHREGYRCVDKNIYQTRLMEQLKLDIIFFSLQIINEDRLIEKTFNEITPILTIIFNQFEKNKKIVSEIDVYEELLRRDIDVGFKEKAILQEVFLANNWLKYKEKYSSKYLFKLW